MPGEKLQRRVWNRQTKLTYNHWLVALVKEKCSSTKATRLATGAVCHPDTEPRGDHLNNSVVHMRYQRNAKKGCFLRLNAIRANRD